MEYRIMLVQEKLLKPIMEARYLTVGRIKRRPVFSGLYVGAVSAGSECSGRLEEPSGGAGYEEGCYD